jgi:hypothetical protein
VIVPVEMNETPMRDPHEINEERTTLKELRECPEFNLCARIPQFVCRKPGA